MKKFLLRLTLILLFGAVVFGFIVYSRGYRVDFKEKTLVPTGILAISSTPRAAKVYVNGTLKGVTDLNLPLAPGSYKVEIRKAGFSPYVKEIKLKGELVETIDPILFPTNPSLAPLTNLGLVKAVRVDQSDRILLFSETGDPEKDGIYLFEAGKSALSLFPPLKTLILKQNLPSLVTLAKNTVYFSYDFKQAIFEFELEDGTTISYLLSLEDEDQQAFEVTISKDALIAAWADEELRERQKILEAFPKEIRKVATDSFQIISFSPDQTKILYRAGRTVTLPLVIKPPLIASNQTAEVRELTEEEVYVYDRKEDKNFRIKNSSPVAWYSDSKRLVFNERTKIAITHYDEENRQVVYSGPFEEEFFSPLSKGTLIVLINLNPQSNKLPDVYEVGIQ